MSMQVQFSSIKQPISADFASKKQCFEAKFFHGTSSDSAKVIMKTTEEWDLQITYIPKRGDIIIYSDYGNLNGQNVPGIKIGDGLAYVVDLPFVGESDWLEFREIFEAHINNQIVHITQEERTSWDNKLNCELNNETLIFNRT